MKRGTEVEESESLLVKGDVASSPARIPRDGGNSGLKQRTSPRQRSAEVFCSPPSRGAAKDATQRGDTRCGTQQAELDVLCESAADEAGGERFSTAGLPGKGWMRVSGALIGHGIRVVTDIDGRDHQGQPFSWRAETHALLVRAEVPLLSCCLPPGPMRTVAFWMGVMYLVGSLLFVFGAAASLNTYVVNHEPQLFAFVDLPYFVGANIFQLANYFAMVEPLNEDLGFRQYLWERSALGGQAPPGSRPPTPRPSTRWIGFTNRPPFWGGLFYFLGGLAYCVMTAVPMLDDDPSALAEALAVDFMAVLGGVGFVMGAYCYCYEYGLQLSQKDPNARAAAGPFLFYLLAGTCPIAGSHELLSVGFLINSANMLGSIGFLLSGFFCFAGPGSVPRLLIEAETFVGFFLGSVLFLIGSILLLMEVYQPTSRTRRRFEELRRVPIRKGAHAMRARGAQGGIELSNAA